MISHRGYTYPAKLSEQDDGSWLVTFRDLPDALTDGGDQEEAFEEAVDCLGAAIASRLLMGEDVSPPSAVEEHEFPVPLTAGLSAKAVLHAAMAEDGLSKSALARQMGCDEKVGTPPPRPAPRQQDRPPGAGFVLPRLWPVADRNADAHAAHERAISGSTRK